MTIKALLACAIVALAFANPAVATYNCTTTAADPSTYREVGGIYVYESETFMDVPGSGLIVGDGTWIYQETNGLAGLQRGGTSAAGETHAIWDETCGAGPDLLIA